MKTVSKLLMSLILITFLSCNGSETTDNSLNTDSTTVAIIDTVQEVIVDTTSILPDSLVEAGYVDETEENISKIEKKYGKQWDFCDCVVKTDSVNKALEKMDGLTEEESNKLFDRWDEVDLHCKELITAPNTTPDERAKHKRKVKKCLRNAK